jgi:hypothetical protein
LAHNISPLPPLWRSLLLPTAALGSIALAWGFTVDDALISTRVAHHLRTLGRYAFNPDGPRVDCVTPLGWAWFLSPFARSSAWAGLEAARFIGAACTIATAFIVNSLMTSTSSRLVPWQYLLPAAGLWLANLPLGAWASAGMETPVVMLLCTAGTWGCVTNRSWGYACAGIAAALRPELVPWALVQTTGSIIVELRVTPTKRQRLRSFERLLLVLLPPIAIGLTRWIAFGSPTPLAVLAKPSDAASGFTYVRGGLTLLGIPFLLLAGRSWAKAPSSLKCVGCALLAHVLALIAAGGDWMSLFRLFIPVLPTMLWLGTVLTAAQSWQVQVAKYALAFIPTAVLHLNLGPTSTRVLNARHELVQGAAAVLATQRNVATLDVGWVGAATSATVTDLAGVTDREIAALPGGHTSKRLPHDLLVRRNVDALVLLLKPNHQEVTTGQHIAGLEFARVAESRVALLEQADTFRVTATLALGGTDQRYVVLTR